MNQRLFFIFFFIVQIAVGSYLGDHVQSNEKPVIVWDLHGVIVLKEPGAMIKHMVNVVWQSSERWSLIALLLNPLFWYNVYSLKERYTIPDDFFEELVKDYPILESQKDELLSILEHYKPNMPVITFIDELDAGGYKQFIASNISPSALEALKRRHPNLFKRFAGIYTAYHKKPDGSLYAHKGKPEAEYYEGFREYLAREHGINKNYSLLFIDDHRDNINVAQKEGFEGILFLSADSLKNEFLKRNLIESANLKLTH